MTNTETLVSASDLRDGDLLHRPAEHRYLPVTVNKTCVPGKIRVFITTEGSWGYIDLDAATRVTVLR